MFVRKPKFISSIPFAAAALLSVTLLGSSAFAGPEDSKDAKKQVMEQPDTAPKFYLSLGGNTDFDLHAVYYTTDAVGSAFGLPATVEARSFGATHDQPYSVHAEFGYVASPHWEIFGTVYYDGADGNDERVGTVSDPTGAIGAVGAKHALNAEFDDYHSIGIELGARYFFLPKTARLRPFISVSAGGRYIDSQDITFSVAGVGSTTASFYDDSFSLSASFLAGVEFAITDRFSVGVQSGISYQFEQTERDEKLTPNSAQFTTGGIAGLQGANDDGDRLYIPVAVYGKFRF